MIAKTHEIKLANNVQQQKSIPKLKKHFFDLYSSFFDPLFSLWSLDILLNPLIKINLFIF